MTLNELSPSQRDWFIGTLFGLTYPVYCTTGIHDFDYHFIGSGFLLQWEERLFFLLTAHQVKLARNETIFFSAKAGEKCIRLDQGKVLMFEGSDVVISELNTQEEFSELKPVQLPMLRQLDNVEGPEYVVAGYQQVLNAVDWENKRIRPIPGGVVAHSIKHGQGCDSIELDLSNVSIGILPAFRTFEDLTQGLSGSPVFALKINSATETTANVEMCLLGIATHVSETNRKLYLTRTFELLSCLNSGFKVFAEFEAMEKK